MDSNKFYGTYEDLKFNQDDAITFQHPGFESILEGRICGKSCNNPNIWIVKTGKLFSDVYPYDTVVIPQSYILKP